MSEGANSGLPPVQDLTDAEQTLIALVRDGRMDAEIAVRLGLPTGEVKARIERLCTKLGARDRTALRDGVADVASPPPSSATSIVSGQQRTATSLIVAVAVGFLLGVGLMYLLPGRDEPRPLTAAPLAAPSATSVPAASPSATVTRTPKFGVIGIDRAFDLGEMFVVLGKRFASVDHFDTRFALATVYLAGPAVVRFDGDPTVRWGGDAGSETSAFISADVFGADIGLYFEAGDESTRFIHGAANSVSIYTTAPSPARPVVLVTARNVGSPTHAARHRVAFDYAGTLFISTDPVPGSVAVNEPTGDVISLAGLTAIGRVAAPGYSDTTICDSDGCSVRDYSGGATMPLAGTLSCAADGSFVVKGAVFVLEFRNLNHPPGDPPYCLLPNPVSVARGDSLPTFLQYTVTATTLTGMPLSVVSDDDGMLYAGPFSGTFACPCLRSD
jgi:DNA-binding CsgD family transcriptional regulator